MKKNNPFHHYSSFHHSRRSFIKNSAKGSALFLMSMEYGVKNQDRKEDIIVPEKLNTLSEYSPVIDLSPARWIWFPSQRTLPNTVFLFRKKINIEKPVASASGWILGESRYHLYVNGKHEQFGPAPSDPRFSEVDKTDLTQKLTEGENIIGAEVLFYGFGDGTWPIGKPGFIFKLEIIFKDGSRDQIVSDVSWLCKTANSWQPGQYKRWYLRAFQEDFDARKYPYNWTSTGFQPDNTWQKAMILNNPSDLPAICSYYDEYMFEIQGQRDECLLRERSIPSIKHIHVPVKRLPEKKIISWRTSPEEYFQMVTPDAYQVEEELTVSGRPDQLTFSAENNLAYLLTFELEEQIVGFPYFSIDAPEGTIIEMMVQEGHAIDTDTPVMNNHFHSWTRFTCKEGKNYFRSFDYESLRWLQLHIRNTSGTISISNVGVKRRIYDWPEQPEIKISDEKIQKVMNAAVNTLHNAAQETIVDGMGRERQQYSGDVGHQLHAIFYTFGETKLPSRYLNTFSQGLTYDGYFLDSWPAYDRLARLMERQLNLTQWGPILDHSVGFNFDSYHYFLYTGDLNALKEVYPRLLVFRNFLESSVDPETGLLPVENMGIPYVWIDHDAYRKQKHKQCAYNLYVAAMLKNALGPLAEALDDEHNREHALNLGDKIHKSVLKHFWSDSRKSLIINKPWLSEENTPLYCDRSLATAVMFDLIPDEGIIKAVSTLAENPENMGLSYPANAGWRYWALAKGGRMDVVIHEIRNKWASLDSVQLNNTLQEAWEVQPDSNSQWSHCPVAPLYMLFMGIAGLEPLKPGFDEVRIWPQPGELDDISFTAQTVKGPIHFESSGKKGTRKLNITLPEKTTGILKIDNKEKIDLELSRHDDYGYSYYKVPPGSKISLNLKFT